MFSPIRIGWLLVACLLQLSIWSGCAKKAAVPAYIQIPSVSLVTNPNDEGANTHAITDIWVYVDDNLQGIYPLPANFPLTVTGKHTIELFAGVRHNGTASERVKYPFYIGWKKDVDLVPEGNVELKPVFEYYSTKNSNRKTKFYWREDFESQSLSFARGNKDTTNSLLRTSDPALVRSDKYSGVCRMDSSTIIEFISKDNFQLPVNADIVLEVDYKTNTSLSFGFYAYSQTNAVQTPIVDLYDTGGEWKKAYIFINEDVTKFLNSNQNQTCVFQPFVGCFNTGSGVVPEFYLDNIKLISFE